MEENPRPNEAFLKETLYSWEVGDRFCREMRPDIPEEEREEFIEEYCDECPVLDECNTLSFKSQDEFYATIELLKRKPRA